jgi:hypothetical protein
LFTVPIKRAGRLKGGGGKLSSLQPTDPAGEQPRNSVLSTSATSSISAVEGLAVIAIVVVVAAVVVVVVVVVVVPIPISTFAAAIAGAVKVDGPA